MFISTEIGNGHNGFLSFPEETPSLLHFKLPVKSVRTGPKQEVEPHFQFEGVQTGVPAEKDRGYPIGKLLFK